MVGSSSSSTSVSWARAIAIHTRCRCPPESSSTFRPASSSVSVAAIACCTARSSSAEPPAGRGPEEALVRVAAAAHEVPDGDAVRRRGMLRKQAQGAGHFAGGTAVDVAAVQGDRAGRWLEQPGEAPEQGGFAAGVGADDHGHLALGDFRRRVPRSRSAGRISASGRRSEELPSQASFRLEVTSSQSRNGAPRAPVMTPTGRTVPSSSSGAILAAT